MSVAMQCLTEYPSVGKEIIGSDGTTAAVAIVTRRADRAQNTILEIPAHNVMISVVDGSNASSDYLRDVDIRPIEPTNTLGGVNPFGTRVIPRGFHLAANETAALGIRIVSIYTRLQVLLIGISVTLLVVRLLLCRRVTPTSVASQTSMSVLLADLILSLEIHLFHLISGTS